MSKNNPDIQSIKRQLGMLRPDEQRFSIPARQRVLTKDLAVKVARRIIHELRERKATAKFVPKRPSSISPKNARRIAQELEFKKAKDPEVSIVIPIYNKFELTINCLKSIKDNVSSKHTYEVVVVNNDSSDDSHKYISKIPGITYINNKENMGFVDGCNGGAKKAKGKYIVFLNNDTSVNEGWLESLVSTIESDPKIGLVGSKLIFPNGNLQEAGGIIFSDGTGANYGKHDNPGDYKYNYVREADYCSAASVIIERSFFNKIGMFDKLYAPAYYEDTDLAFKVRDAGYKVVYQPSSVAFHIEGATAGTSTSSGFKKYQEINHKKFLKKWAKELKQQYKPEEMYLARDRKAQKLALIVDEHVPRRDVDSGSVRMFRTIQALQKLGYKVTFFPQYTGYTGSHVSELQQMGVEVIYGNINFSHFVKEYGSFYDFIMLSRPRIASFYMDICRIYAPNAQIIYDTVDLHYLRLGRQIEFEKGSEKKRIKNLADKHEIIEKHLMKQADATFVVSEYEKQLLESDGLENIAILSNIHEIVEDSYKSKFNDRKDLLFVGGYQHPPNVDAIKWFISDIFPSIQSRLKGINIHVVGSRMPEDLEEYLSDKEGVINHGFASNEELAELLKTTRVFVTPLRYGAGVKGKVGQAIEHGLPVVSTKVGVEGMKLEDKKACLIADDKKQFAKQVVSLYKDEGLWKKIQGGAQSVLERDFSAQKAESDIKAVIG